MPYVEATGAKLYFEESGYGYPIIFIHELASDIRGWEAQTRYFSRGYRCIAYNARGYRVDVSRGERVGRVVAHHVGAEVHAGSPRVSAELPETGERFEGLLPPVVAANRAGRPSR